MNSASPQVQHKADGDASRFEDAEDDESDVGMAYASPVVGGHGGGEYPLVGSVLADNPYRASTPASSAGSSYRAASPVLSIGGASSVHRRSADVTSVMSRPRFGAVRGSSREGAGASPTPGSAASPSRPANRQTVSYASYATTNSSTSGDKENVRFSAVSNASSASASGNPGLGLSYPRGAPPPVAPRPGLQQRQALGLAISGANANGGRGPGAGARDTMFGDYEFVERPSMDEQQMAAMYSMQPKLKKKKREPPACP